MADSDGIVRPDWHALAIQLGALREDGESGGSDLARRALELIIGVDKLRDAVDHYVAYRHGYELARSVLMLLQPASAMERCRELSRSDDLDTRRAAVELLRTTADRRVLAWVPKFLDDPDEGVQTWGAGIVDQLVWRGEAGPDECGSLLETMLTHPNAQVRWYAEQVRRRLESERGS